MTYPWFKFNPDEWRFGSITSTDMCTQGLFINICAYYWKKEGIVTSEDLRKKYGKFDGFSNLIDMCIYESDGMVVIKFLDEQINENNAKAMANSKNGTKGAEIRKTSTNTGTLSQAKATLKPGLSHPKATLKPPLSQAKPPLSGRQADIDLDLDSEEENKKNIFSEISEIKKSGAEDGNAPGAGAGEKFETDPKLEKSLKRLNSAKSIDLEFIEENFFAGRGTAFVIQEFQKHFETLGYRFVKDSATLNCFLGWTNKLKMKSFSDKIDEKFIPITKQTPELELKMAEFRTLEGLHSPIRTFVIHSKAKKRKELIEALIEKHGLEETIRKIFTYWMKKNQMHEDCNTVEHFIETIPKMSIEDGLWKEIMEAREIKFNK